MKALGLLFIGGVIFLGIAVSQPKPADYSNPRFIRYVENYPHGPVPIARKNGCAVFAVDGGTHWLRVCDFTQALFRAE